MVESTRLSAKRPVRDTVMGEAPPRAMLRSRPKVMARERPLSPPVPPGLRVRVGWPFGHWAKPRQGRWAKPRRVRRSRLIVHLDNLSLGQ
jgi:hypothetical protein